jgi:UDP-N-acetylglucosamine acyltransferase
MKLISEKALIGENTIIEPLAIIEDDVIIGDNCIIQSGAKICNGARIGSNVKVYSYAVVSGEPQDLKYKGEKTYTFIDNNTTIREFATVNRGTVETGMTKVGKNCLIMSYCHIAHDCILGDNVILSNVTQLAGHVVLEDWVIMGGVSKVHQFCKIGKHSMIGADTKIVMDVAPYTLVDGNPARVETINKIGLKRRGFAPEIISEIEEFYDTLLFSGLNNKDGISKFLERKQVSEEVLYCINFIKNSKRGIHR